MYAHKSTDVVRNLFNEFVDKLKMTDNKKFRIYASRVTDNLIVSRFGYLNITLYITNLVYDYDKLKSFHKLVSKDDKYKNTLMIYECLNKLIFYNSYTNIDTYYLPLFTKLLDMNGSGRNKINKRVNIFDRNNVLSRLFYNTNMDRFIFIGKLVLNKVYGYRNVNIGDIYEVIYTGNFNNYINYLSDRKGYTIVRSSSDYSNMNHYVDIKLHSNKSIRIYNGLYHCYPYISIGSKYGTNVGTLSLVLRYIMLRTMFEKKLKNMGIIWKILGDLKKVLSRELFKDNCIGRTITPYYKYRKKIFGSKTWEFKKTIGTEKTNAGDEYYYYASYDYRDLGSRLDGDKVTNDKKDAIADALDKLKNVEVIKDTDDKYVIKGNIGDGLYLYYVDATDKDVRKKRLLISKRELIDDPRELLLNN
jgi:hypothetical protein